MVQRFSWKVIMLGILAMLLSPNLSWADKSEVKSRPNVLFIAIDDLNDWVGVLGGHPQALTPNLDKLAKKGMLFSRAYCAAPSCNPSRASMLTGKRPSTSGVYDNGQPWRSAMPDAVTLPAYFLQHGYLVLGGGKIFHGGFPDAKAWNEYFTGKSKIPTKELPANGIGGNMEWGPVNVDDDAMPDTQLTDWAIQKLKQKHDKPFFMAVGYVKPHLAWHAPKKYFDMHPLDKVQLPKVDPKDLDDVPAAGIRMAKPESDHKKIVEKGVWKEAVQAYLANTTFMDTQLGRLLEALEKSEHAANTIIVLWSDHGWHHGQKEHWRKFALWEQANRVPLVWVVPGTTQTNQKCQRTVNLMDIYPTLVELCQLPSKADLEAHSLVPLLRDPQAKWDHPAVMTWGRNNHAVRSERWRYIRYADGSEELYDHDQDPLEWRNLAKDPQWAGIKKELATHFPKVNAPDAPRVKEGKKKKEADETSWLLLPPERMFLSPHLVASRFGEPSWRKE
jgi:arylsulfatase A-like enzyme